MAGPQGLAGYRGHLDAIEPVLSGWVSEIARPSVSVTFELRVEPGYRLPVVADRARPDVAAAGLAGANCGFAATLPPALLDGAEHALALVLPDGRDLDLPGGAPLIALGAVTADLLIAPAPAIDAVLELLRLTDQEGGFDPCLVRREHAAAFNAIGDDSGFVLYARANGRLVGYARLDRGRGDIAGAGVVALTILRAYRRKGIGERLMRELQRQAVRRGWAREVWLSVRPDNVPALALYEKLGFRHRAPRPGGHWAVPGELTMIWLPHPPT